MNEGLIEDDITYNLDTEVFKNANNFCDANDHIDES